VLGQAAMNEAPGSEDARLQELVGAIALDLEPDGQLGDSLAQTLSQARLTLNPLSCSRHMQKRLSATGSSATLPNILKAVDFDRDGTPDSVKGQMDPINTFDFRCPEPLEYTLESTSLHLEKTTTVGTCDGGDVLEGLSNIKGGGH
jgi:hypothetical protein